MSQTVLVVDDNASAAESLAQVFRKAGFAVDWALSAEDALARMKASRPDALVIDERLPGLSGVSLVRCLRTFPGWAAVPCLMLTAVDGAAFGLIEEELQGLQPARAVRKPEDVAVIVGALRSMLEGSRVAAG